MTLINKILSLSTSLSLLLACSQHNTPEPANSPIDCLRKFYFAYHHNHLQHALHYTLPDNTNTSLLNIWHQQYPNLQPDLIKNITQSSLIILKDSTINDSTNLIKYYFSFNNKILSAPIIKKNTLYFLDFKNIQ